MFTHTVLDESGSSRGEDWIHPQLSSTLCFRSNPVFLLGVALSMAQRALSEVWSLCTVLTRMIRSQCVLVGLTIEIPMVTLLQLTVNYLLSTWLTITTPIEV
jgi:hypothetical protein